MPWERLAGDAVYPTGYEVDPSGQTHGIHFWGIVLSRSMGEFAFYQ
jgi:hypothetical protein